MSRIITAEFTPNNKFSKARGNIWQYDYGLILRLQGLNLPAAVEIHFSSVERGGEAETRIGVTADGITDVKIPNTLLELQRTQDYDIYAFVYLANDKSGYTEYKVKMTVRARPKPGEERPDPEEEHPFDDAVQKVSEYADRAETAAKGAEQSAAAAKESEERSGETAAEVQENAKQVESARKETAEWAELAKQVATKNGFCQLQINDAGHLILNRTDNVVNLLDFNLTKDGHLEVIASEN